MVVKLNSLSRWSVLGADEAIKFRGRAEVERNVRIDFNLEAVTTFFIGDDDGNQMFLCTIGPGLETVQFNAKDDFNVYAEKGSGIVHFLSSELEPTFAEVIDPVIFTKIANRRHRNPELEEMMYRAQANIERRLAQQADQLQAAFDRRIKEMTNGRPSEIVNSDAPGSAAAGAGAQVPAQVAGGEEPGPDLGTPPVGKQPGGAGV